jgi:flagellar hook-associated protein 2
MSSVSAVNTLLSGTATTTPAINISTILAADTGATTPGIDVTSAVAAAIYADRAPERIWQADQTTLSSQTTALTAIQTATSAVATDMQALNTLTGPLAARTVTSSSSDVIATAATGTVAGLHTVVVNSLAATGAWYSDLETSPTAALPNSSITITAAAGPSLTIPTGTGTGAVNSLNALATAINADTSLGVNASVVSDSTGSRLAIISNSSGAKADFSVSGSYTSWTAPELATGGTLGANSITLNIGGTPATITTTAGETYAQLATAINNAPNNITTTTDNTTTPPTTTTTPHANVTATAGIDPVTGDATLTIVSNTSSQFSINEPSTTASSTTGFGFTQAVTGADASATVDGVPIDSASNTITGAIPGVTLTLLGTTSGVPADLTVASDATQVSTAINQFVTDYNTAIGLVNAQYNFNSTTETEGVLASDPTVSSLQSALEQALNYTVTPAAGTTTTVSSLNDLGITTNADGTLSVDSTTLDNALTNNPSDVQNFFEGASLNGFANSLSNSLNTFTDPANGAFTVDLSSMSASSANLTSQINNFESGYIASQQTSLTAMYSAAEIALQQLPQEMAQINAELGNSPSGNSNQ